MKKNKEIAIGITTFLRDDSLFRLIKSLATYCPEFKIYIVDQGEYSSFKKIIYTGLKNLGHSINNIPFDSGISMARKTLKSMCQEPYLVYMQDDFVVTEKTNLYILKNILEENKKIGVVGGKITNASSLGFYFDFADDKLVYFPTEYLLNKNLISWQQTLQNHRFIFTEIIPDFTMWKKEVPNIFDINVKTIEHSFSYLLLKYHTKYKVAYCPACEISHLHDTTNKDYNVFRNRKTDLEYLKSYWNINNFYKLDKALLTKLEQSLSPTTVNIIKPIDIPTKIVPIKSENTNIEPNSSSQVKPLNSANIIKLLLNYNINFYLAKQSCLSAVKNQKIDANYLYIGLFLKSQSSRIKNIYPYENLIIVDESIKNTKTINIDNMILKIPFPVIRYLEKCFNKTWNELKND